MGFASTAFIATAEANAGGDYNQMLVDSSAEDVIYTPYYTSIHANYLKKSLIAEGLDLTELPTDPESIRAFQSQPGRRANSGRNWGRGQGVGVMQRVMSVEALAAHLEREYVHASKALALRNEAWREG